MKKQAKSKQASSESMSHENPLVPYSRMKQMYEGIVQSRLLEDALQKRHKKAKLTATLGQEACRVSTLIGLGPEDLISDLALFSTALLRGAKLKDIAACAEALASGKKHENAVAKLNLSSLLPATEKTADRLKHSAGAALALKRLKLPRLVVVFALPEEINSTAGKKTLELAAREQLPLLFVVLPEPTPKQEKQSQLFRLSKIAVAAGVPGIPVDADDAVALYRVAQECIGRLHGGDGPALMECRHLVLKPGKKTSHPAADLMERTLLDRKVCKEPWLTNVASTFAMRLKAL